MGPQRLKTYAEKNEVCPIHQEKGCATCNYVADRCLATASLGDWNWHIARILHGAGMLGEYIRIPCPHLTLPEILRKHNILTCDILKIDAEGSDIGILLTAFEWWEKCGPASYPEMIVFEAHTGLWWKAEALVELFKKNLDYELWSGISPNQRASCLATGRVKDVVLVLKPKMRVVRRKLLEMM